MKLCAQIILSQVVDWKLIAAVTSIVFILALRKSFQLFCWKHWSIDVFSAGPNKERNEPLIREFMLLSFAGCGIKNPESLYDDVVKSGRCIVKSRCDLIKFDFEHNKYFYENAYSDYKNDLRVFDKNINNSILVDDDRGVVLEDQYPYSYCILTCVLILITLVVFLTRSRALCSGHHCEL